MVCTDALGGLPPPGRPRPCRSCKRPPAEEDMIRRFASCDETARKRADLRSWTAGSQGGVPGRMMMWVPRASGAGRSGSFRLSRLGELPSGWLAGRCSGRDGEPDRGNACLDGDISSRYSLGHHGPASPQGLVATAYLASDDRRMEHSRCVAGRLHLGIVQEHQPLAAMGPDVVVEAIQFRA
jgi:hypothetical protein